MKFLILQKKNHESKHNLKYWTMEYYLSLGPAAHGFIPNGRYSNAKSINEYLNENFSFEYTKPDYYTEMCLCLFRLFKPINLNFFLQDVSSKQEKKLYNYLKKLSEEDLCLINNSTFQWNSKAVLNLDFYIFELCNL